MCGASNRLRLRPSRFTPAERTATGNPAKDWTHGF